MFKRINVLEEEHGSNLEAQAEVQRLKQVKKNYETELENKKKEIAALKKIAKNKETAQKKKWTENVQNSLKKKEKET